MGDGLHFQFLFCCGVLLMGVISLFVSPVRSTDDVTDWDSFPFPDFEAVFSTEGLLGGFVWCCGNLLTVPIIDMVGLGIGQSVWAGTSVAVSYVVGRVSIFGLEPEELSSPGAGVTGLLISLLALVVFSLIQTNEKKKNSSNLEEELLTDSDIEITDGYEMSQEMICRNEVLSTGKFSKSKKGVFLALLAGSLYGFQFVPLQIHSNQYKKSDNVSQVLNSMRFFFSQFAGIFLSSVFSFGVYICKTGNKPKLVPNDAVGPSILSGMIWSLGAMSGMVATSELGLTVGYPLSVNLVLLVNGAWSCFVYKEITGKRNVLLFALAGGLNVVSTILLAISRS
mmetsp:Transcript_15953/g.19794  ORF Transcript_15953/g.19794 Transcript_15953/m.19794 type:complete len:338 (+) Transcript_15953:1-1014(+)